MNILKQLFNSSEKRTIKESSVIDTQQKPIIQYENHVITPDNINRYRSNFDTLAGGHHKHGTNIVTIYRYTLHPDLHLSTNDEIYKFVKFMQTNETNVLAHETKHWKNEQFGEPMLIAKNYYELTGLYAFDELSAYTAGFLTQEKDSAYDTHSYICAAVYEGINALLCSKEFYLQSHMTRIIPKYMLDCMTKGQKTVNENMALQIIQPKYSETFNKTVANYLTFDGQCLYSKDKPLPSTVKQKLSELRKTYENATRQTLENLLQSR